MKIRGIIPVDSGFRYSQGNTKPYSMHFSNVLQLNEITIEGEGQDYLPKSEKKQS